jgi:hypothetical protein
LALLRIVLVLHVLGIAVQAMLAGQFLAGGDGSVVWHEKIGLIVAALGLLQILVAAIRRVPRPTLLPFLLSSVLIFLAEGLQVGTGYGRFLTVHVPLGVFVFGGVVAQAVWLFL